MEFRKDVNGLRAIAVLAVVLFHFNHNVLPSGFVGVDVFFVISGFLMTAIIYEGITKRKFKLWDFYKARGRRILPALFTMIFVVLIYGWFYMFTTEFKTLGKHATSSLLFISNIVYWKESSYFAPGAEEKWLLHTWSLSVEWQFYLLYPVFLLVVRRVFNDKVAKIIVIFAALVSLVISIYASRILVSSSFYLLPTRAWEMMAGGIVFLFPLNKLHGIKFEIIGIVLIIVSLFLFNGEDYWPSYNALLPVIGSMLVISSYSQHGLLSLRPFQFLGSSSYSIYLWHWPIYVFIYNYYGGVSFLSGVIGIIISMLVGWASYRIIETPCKSNGLKKNWFFYFLCLALSIFMYHDRGVKGLYRPITETSGNELVEHYDGYNFDVGGMWDKCNASEKLKNIDKSCVDTKSHGGVFLWGDSHAGALSLGIRSLLDKSVPFNQLAASSCKPSLTKFPGVISATVGCNYSNEKAIHDIAIIKPEVVVMAQRFQHDKTDWKVIAEKLHLLGVRRVLLLGPVPQWKGSLPLIVAKNYPDGDYFIGEKYLDREIVKTNNKMKGVTTKWYEYIDIFDALCKDNNGLVCRARVDSGYTLMSMDYGHPTDDGSKFIANEIIKSYMPTDLLKAR
ncbi:acyltransferase family protein [Mixta gaviniae]|uniref:Acyltransferase n=1 Tax=Mixta gaviniae TaxID=665914 RepID=A0A2L0IH30_9GAMM|nr:acyltransferase family protein [Mixta gaviniae]AUX93877.1 acyltransferase [Mixta gaviniae]